MSSRDMAWSGPAYESARAEIEEILADCERQGWVKRTVSDDTVIVDIPRHRRFRVSKASTGSIASARRELEDAYRRIGQPWTWGPSR